jgi:signal peptidase I
VTGESTPGASAAPTPSGPPRDRQDPVDATESAGPDSPAGAGDVAPAGELAAGDGSAAPAPAAPQPRAGGRSQTVGCAVELVQTLVLTLLLFFGIQTFVVQPFEVEQQSMEQTLEPGDYVLVDKLTPRWDAYDRGDIVVFVPPPGWVGPNGTPFIKRVIGVGGETVEIGDDGLIHVDGAAIDEPYLYAVDGEPQPTTVEAGADRWVVPQGSVFVLGDHREASQDSREFGPIEISSVVGRASVRYWPLGRVGILATPRYGEP